MAPAQTSSDPLSLIPKGHFRNSDAGKFSPKLDFAERCAVLGLIRSGVKRDVVAEAFGIDRRTVSHISNPASLRYRSVREQYTKEGHEEFIRKYVTEPVALKVAAVSAKVPEAKSVPNGVSSRAARLAGMHKVQPDQCSYPHHIEVKYLADGEFGAGWYYRDIDSKANPETWLHSGDDSRKTSQACFDAAVENLIDD